MSAVKGNGWGGARPNTGGARPNAGRKRGGHNRATLERKAMLEKAAEEGLMPVDFMLQEMRNPENPKEMRLELARWVAPFITPRLSAAAVVKSVHAMTDEELEWAIADAQKPGPRPAGWHRRVIGKE